MTKRKIEIPSVVAVVHSSGNMGKSTIARYLLAPNMEGAAVFCVEDQNTSAFDGVNGVEHIVGKQFRTLQDEILISGAAVVDVGSSEFGEFARHLVQYAGSHDDFCFIVPAGGRKKQIGDTILTVKLLAGMGVRPGNIRMVFSNVDREDVATLESDYCALFNFNDTENLFTMKPAAVVYRNEVFDLLKTLGKDLQEVLSDETDWRAKIREAHQLGDRDARGFALQMVAAQRLAVSAKANLDQVYQELFS